MAPSLKHKTVSGVKWQVINKVLQKVISVATFAILARILQPKTFGLFALAFTAIDGFHIFKSFGLDTALVQRKDRLDEASHTAYFIVQANGILMCAACYLVAPLAAHFFHNDDVLSVIRALGVIFIFSSFSKIPSTLLQRDMRFAVLSAIDLIGGVINCVCAVAFAMISPTVWALVGAYIVKQITIALLSRQASGFRLKWQFDRKIASELLHYGKFMVGMSLVGYAAGNLNNIITGRMLGVVALGYYALAANMGNFINTHFTILLEGVMFPAYSSLQHDKEAVRRAYLKTTKFVSVVSVPFSIALMTLAPEFVRTLYGEKWLSIVPLIQLFGAMQLLVPILVCSGSVFLGCGKPKYSFNLTLYYMIMKIPLMILFIKLWGVIGVVLTEAALTLFFAPINVALVRGLVRFRFRDFFAQFIPSFLCSLAMLAALFFLKKGFYLMPFQFVGFHHIVPLVVFFIAGLGVYAGAFFIVDRNVAKEVFRLLLRVNLGKAA